MKSFYRISQSGFCPTVLSAIKLGYKPLKIPPYLEKSAKEGKIHEEAIAKDLIEEGLSLERVQDCEICHKLGWERHGVHVEYDINEHIALTGHLDARILDDTKSVYFPTDIAQLIHPVCEIKSKSADEYSRWLRDGWSGFENEASQITVYMKINRDIRIAELQNDPRLGKLKELPMLSLYAVKNRNSGDIDKFVQEGTPLDFDCLVNKFIAVERCVKKKELYIQEPDWGSLQCQRCLYQYVRCLADTPAEFTETIQKEPFLQHAEDWRQGKKLVTQGQTMVDKAESFFKGFVEAHSKNKTEAVKFETGKLRVNGYVVKGYTLPARQISPYWKCVISDLDKPEEEI